MFTRPPLLLKLRAGPAIGAVRLYGGALPASGMLQVCNRDIGRSSGAASNPLVWGAVCGAGFKIPAAKAVCRCGAAILVARGVGD